MDAYPTALEAPLQQALQALGDSSTVRSAKPLGGGCINNALRLETSQGRYLLKWNADPLPGMFTSEAKGLKRIAETRTVRVPVVYAAEEAQNGRPAFILLEFLKGSRTADQEKLGTALAAMHRQGSAPYYGLEDDNYIGSTPQINGWEPDWPEFFATRRLVPQMDLAQKNRLLSADRGKRLERLIERLPDLLAGGTGKPALIHGDLWGGNVIPAPNGLALIDPAISYSDREAEIAYTELFGGFSARFYAAYRAAWPLNPGYADRRDIYNLYHLLNHLNLFGESYGYQVDMILKRYVG